MSTAETELATPPDDPGRSASWWRPNRRWLPSGVVAAVAIVVFAFARTTLIDDAYITLAYARNLAFHLHWGLIPGATANTATSVLYVIVLAIVTAITRHVVVALGIVFVLSTMALEYGLRRVATASRLPRWFGVAATVLIALNPLLMSSIGLEVSLSAGLIGLLLAAAVERRPVWFGVLAGLVVLARPDLVIIVLVMFFGRSAWYRGWWRSLLAALAVTLPWYLWSWIGLGSIVPDTLLIKTGQGAWPGYGKLYTFGNGPLLYLRNFPAPTVLSFLPMLLGALALVVWAVARIAGLDDRGLGRIAPLGIAGVLYYAAYSRLHVPPYHWYYGPSIVCLTIFLAGALGALAVGHEWSWRSGLASAAVVVLALVFVANYATTGLPRRFAPITTNWASPQQYATIGREVAAIAHGRVVRSSGEIGGEAFFCDCSVVDEFSDRADVVSMVRTREAHAGPLKRLLLRVNFHFLDRDQQPMTPQLVLTVVFGPPPRDALADWPVDTPWVPGKHSIALLPATG